MPYNKGTRGREPLTTENTMTNAIWTILTADVRDLPTAWYGAGYLVAQGRHATNRLDGMAHLLRRWYA